MLDRPAMKTIPFEQWRVEIAPLWAMEGAEAYLPHLIDGYGQMQHTGRSRLERVLCFPIAAELEGQRVGWTSVFNVSDEAIRIRGIYVLPEARARGIGYAMVHHAMSLWPKPWKHVFMYARANNVERYLRWGFTIPQGFAHRTWEDARLHKPVDIVLMHKTMNAS
jgi:GNAT superfamily N-acetyltransferase